MGCNSSKMPIKEPTPLPVRVEAPEVKPIKPKVEHQPSNSEKIHENRKVLDAKAKICSKR